MIWRIKQIGMILICVLVLPIGFVWEKWRDMVKEMGE